MALHTSAGCNMSASRLMTGSAGQYDCHNLVNSNTGCTVYAPAPATYGAAFNDAGGGVMALELRNEGIRIWQFFRSGIPVDVLAGSPDPSTWGPALADYPGTSCDIGRHFRNQSIIANIDLCGDFVNSNYATSGCKCDDFFLYHLFFTPMGSCSFKGRPNPFLLGFSPFINTSQTLAVFD